MMRLSCRLGLYPPRAISRLQFAERHREMVVLHQRFAFEVERRHYGKYWTLKFSEIAI